MSAIANVKLTWNETNPGWDASTIVLYTERDGTISEMANRQGGSGFDPIPAIWHTLYACARDLDCHPGRIAVTITVDAADLEEIIRRQPLRG